MARLQDRHGHPLTLNAHHRIGRSRSMDLVLSSPDVSAQHAEITWTETGWTVRDLASRNGTVLNGRRLEEDAAPLLPGSVLEFGSAAERFVVLDGRPPVGEEDAAPLNDDGDPADDD